MKKALSFLLILCLLLTGCHGTLAEGTGGAAENFTAPEEFDGNKPYTVTFWAKNDTNKAQTAVYEQAIRDFEGLYPNITVNMRLYTDYTRIYNDVITNISTNTTPNVCITYPDHIATYLTGEKTVVGLDSLLTDPRFGLGGEKLRYEGPKEIVDTYLKECTIDGQTVAIPYMRSTEACYVNKDFVEKLGFTLPETLTWDFVWQVSEAAMAKNADGTYQVNGQKVLIPFIYKSTDNMMIQALQQQGAGYARADGTVELWNEDTKEILKTVAQHTATGAFSTFKISSYPANFLNAGQCVFAVDSTAGATWMGSGAPLLDISQEQVVQFETAVRPVPQFDPENPKMISQGPSVCIFNKSDPQEVLASWLFAQFLLTNDVQIAYAGTEGYVPVTTKAQESEAYQDYLRRAGQDSDHYDIKIAASQLLLNNTGNTFVTPVFNGSASLRAAAGQMIEETAKSVLRKQNVDAASIDALFEKMISLYRLDQIETGDTRAELGPLPAESRALLWALGLCWAGICLYLAVQQVKKRKNSVSSH